MEKPRSVHFEIPGAPVAMQLKIGRNGIYNAKAHHMTNYLVALSGYDGPLLEGPLLLNVTFYMPIARTASKKKVQDLIGKPHPHKPDSDNLLKWLCDLCVKSRTVLKDDCSIAIIQANKQWELYERARTVLTLSELPSQV